MARRYQVEVVDFMGEKKMIDLCDTEEQMRSLTVKQLREKIAEQWPKHTCIHDEDKVKLCFCGRVLDGDSTLLSDYGIQNRSFLHMILKLTGGGMGNEDDTNRSMENLSLFKTF